MKYILIPGALSGLDRSLIASLRNDEFTIFALDSAPFTLKELDTKKVILIQADITSLSSLQGAK